MPIKCEMLVNSESGATIINVTGATYFFFLDLRKVYYKSILELHRINIKIKHLVSII